MYRSARVAAATSAASVIDTRWCASYRSRRPLRISIVCSSDGSPTWIGWNRRSRAASFSMYFGDSSSVVAPIVCSSPRASTCLDQRVQLVDEQDDVAAGLDLLEHLLQALFEVTAVAGAGDQGAQVQRV